MKGHGATDKGKQRAVSPFLSLQSPSSSPPREMMGSASTADQPVMDMFADPQHAL